MSSQIPANHNGHSSVPSVTIVFLVYNRREELRESLERMTRASDYDPARVEVIVVDNGSTDGSADMVEREYPAARLIRRTDNIGVSGWNEGLQAAEGDYVLALDDDCYLPRDGLRRAVAAAEQHQADLVSFRVVSTHDPEHVFTDRYLTGLFSFWGCAVLIRREVVRVLRGYDPEIFVWANELEFMLRFFDRGFRHLHLPEVVAQHMKPPPETGQGIQERGYRINARHWSYIAAKLLAPRDALEAWTAVLVRTVVDGVRWDPVAFKALPDALGGFIRGLRRRSPVRNPELSRCYRRNFETYASPWWLLRPPAQLLRELPREIFQEGLRVEEPDPDGGRRQSYLRERVAFYPEAAALLEFVPGPRPVPVTVGGSDWDTPEWEPARQLPLDG